MLGVHNCLCLSIFLLLTNASVRVVTALDVRGEGARRCATKLDVVGGACDFVHGREGAFFGKVLKVVSEGERCIGDVADIF